MTLGPNDNKILYINFVLTASKARRKQSKPVTIDKFLIQSKQLVGLFYTADI